ncbi:translation factor [Pleurotus eryngii]|uniref:Threonylcarbamoyl-AMP synthase n=1 Tax=Pleurotus eryngii TaxID=5323 RepID=A0A9P5ZIZ1_PLEER|nr:translation factor [Pleurotus eryngii]
MASATSILKCDPFSITFSRDGQPHISDKNTQTAIDIAARQLTESLIPVVVPTETVYGLAAVATDTNAVSRIFSAKGRPADNPLIVHVSSPAMLSTLLPKNYAISPSYRILMNRFWPGALTLLFPREPSTMPDIVTAGQPTVAVRMPSHPVVRALIARANISLAAPSANSSGKPSPTRADHVYRDLVGKVRLILDGGPCDIGLESTVVDGLNPDGDIRILRPGGVTVEDIQKALEDSTSELGRVPKVLVHKRDYADTTIEQVPTTPGMKYRHYSPSIPVILLLTHSQPPLDQTPIDAASYFATLAERPRGSDIRKAGLLLLDDSTLSHLTLPTNIEWLRFPLGSSTDPVTIAQRLFDGILTLEREGVEIIFVEEVDQGREGLAVMNRIRKAASEAHWIRGPINSP